MKLNLAWNLYEQHENHEFLGSYFNDLFIEHPEYFNQRFSVKRKNKEGVTLRSETINLKPPCKNVRKFLNMINTDKKDYFLDVKNILGIGGESIVLHDEQKNKKVAVKFVPIFDKNFKAWFYIKNESLLII